MSARSIRVLVADDDVRLRTELTAFIGELGHTVEAVADGRACVKKVTQDHYDLVLLDLILPGLDGLNVLTAIRGQSPRTTVVIISALDEPEIINSIIRHGAAAFLIKPVQPELVREVIARVAQGTIFSPDSDEHTEPTSANSSHTS